jgi:adenylate cyclase
MKGPINNSIGILIMAKEIERKFLVDVNFIQGLKEGKRISQGYIDTTDNTVVRARIMGNLAFLTLKGEVKGYTCSEFEYQIPLEDAEKIISELCIGKTIDKTRYQVNHGMHLWEIDVFHGENQGLVVAEIELQSESEEIELPVWVKSEVTGQPKYFNAVLLNEPFSKW